MWCFEDEYKNDRDICGNILDIVCEGLTSILEKHFGPAKESNKEG